LFSGKKEQNMDSFKCSFCGHDKAHSRKSGEEMSDRIFDIRNPKTDGRIILRACEKCNIVHAHWSSFKDAEDITDKEKEIAREVIEGNK
jgi:hypothetical protein